MEECTHSNVEIAINPAYITEHLGYKFINKANFMSVYCNDCESTFTQYVAAGIFFGI